MPPKVLKAIAKAKGKAKGNAKGNDKGNANAKANGKATAKAKVKAKAHDMDMRTKGANVHTPCSTMTKAPNNVARGWEWGRIGEHDQ